MTIVDAEAEPTLAVDTAPTDGGEAPPPEVDESAAEDRSEVRDAIASAFPCFGAAIMAGGIFLGAAPRIYGALAVIAGVALAIAVRRGGRNWAALSSSPAWCWSAR